MADGRSRWSFVPTYHPGRNPAGVIATALHLGSAGLRRAALLLIVDFLEIGVDDFVAPAGMALGRTLRRTGFSGRGLFGLLGTIERLAELHRDLGQRLGLGFDLAGVLTAECVLQRLDGLFDGVAVSLRNLVAALLQCPLGRMDQRIGIVFRFDQLAAPLVFLGVLYHAVDIGLRETPRSLDADLLLLAGRLVLSRDLHDAVGVDVEGDLDLWHTAWRRRDADQVELAEQLVVRGHLTLALEDADRNRGLIILGGGEDLALLRRDRCVAIDQSSEDTTQCLDAERQWRHIEQQDVLDLTLQHAGLDRRSDRHDLIRVDAAMRILAKELFASLDDLRHAGHAADKDYLVDLGRLEPGVLQRAAARPDGPLDQVVDQRL